jgi:hypothetical protein
MLECKAVNLFSEILEHVSVSCCDMPRLPQGSVLKEMKAVESTLFIISKLD